ncbi:hypothetical protein LJ08_4390 [Escherichia coli]|nr:hypothetical protein ECLT68_4510 [Escherichia coli LT-68]KGI46868.1 hypothetical protein LJ08_4390 [Escherichia coli]
MPGHVITLFPSPSENQRTIALRWADTGGMTVTPLSLSI